MTVRQNSQDDEEAIFEQRHSGSSQLEVVLLAVFACTLSCLYSKDSLPSWDASCVPYRSSWIPLRPMAKDRQVREERAISRLEMYLDGTLASHVSPLLFLHRRVRC